MAAYHFCRSFDSSLLEIFVIGTEIVDHEMSRDAQKTSPYFAMGKAMSRSSKYGRRLQGKGQNIAKHGALENFCFTFN